MNNPYGRRQRHEIIREQLAKKGFRGVINAKCIDCVYSPMNSGTWRQQVEACAGSDCPLYHVRPRSSSVNGL